MPLAAESLKEDLSLHDYGEQLLILAAKAQPDLVMEAVGKIILGAKDDWKLQIRDIQNILTGNPEQADREEAV